MKSVCRPHSRGITVWSVVLVFICLTLPRDTQALTWTAKWIWQQADGPQNTWVCFRKQFNLSSVPSTVTANIGCDTKYWLWINGTMAVFEGSQFRGPSPGNTWYEEIDIKPYLKSGTNTIAILVWYIGRWHGNYLPSGKGGLVFQSDLGGTTLQSDNTWKMKVHPAYDPNGGGGWGAGGIVAYSVVFDGSKALGDWTSGGWKSETYSDAAWSAAVEKGTPPCSPWNTLVKNDVPSLKNYGLQYYTNYPSSSFPFTTSSNQTITCNLPFDMQINPYLEVDCSSGKTITINTDDGLNVITATYSATNGSQIFEAYSWMNGQQVRYDIPSGVTVKALKYRQMGMGNIVGKFECSDPFYQRLWWMARNGLYVNMRDNFMDCPDRERDFWPGDAADEFSEIFYTMDAAARALARKQCGTFCSFNARKVLAGQYGGLELPSQSLQFAGLQGVWWYYFNTGDLETIKSCYPAIHDYLTIYNMDPDGVVQYRNGWNNWNWDDWGADGDRAIQSCWYYMALQAAKNMAIAIGNTANVGWYDSRMASMKNNFNKVFWNGSSYGHGDDRDNALAMISGLADSSKYNSLVNNVLVSNFSCSPHLEWVVEDAMCQAGRYREALTRMKSRYQGQVNSSGRSTLAEYMDGGGSYNHGWNAPNTILSRHIAGIAPETVGWSTYHVFPHMVDLTSINTTVPCVKGDILVAMNRQTNIFTLTLTSPSGTAAIVGIPKANITPALISVNGTSVWQNGAFTGGVTGVAWGGEDSSYFKFNCAPGTWAFMASVGPMSARITSTAKTAAYVGARYSYAVKATGNPAPTFVASDLPSWLSFDASTATFSGTPGSEGTTGAITVTATNSVGSDSQVFTIGITALSALALTSIRYYPRAGWTSRMIGGAFEGTNGDPATGPYTTLYTIASTPPDGQWTEATSLSNQSGFRYVRYRSAGFCNVAEIEFYRGTQKVTGTVFGTPGSWGNSGNDYTKAFDGNTTTYMDFTTDAGGYTGMDLQNGATVLGDKGAIFDSGAHGLRMLPHALIAVPVGRFSLRVVNAAGVTIVQESGVGPRTCDLSRVGMGMHIVTMTSEGRTISRAFLMLK